MALRARGAAQKSPRRKGAGADFIAA